MAASIRFVARVTVTVGKHVIAQDALAGAYENIRIKESTDGRIVISALQEIEFCFFADYMAMRPVLAHHSGRKMTLKLSALHAHPAQFPGKGQENRPSCPWP